MQRWPIITLRILAIFTVLIFIIYLGIAVYVNNNKKELLVAVNNELNKSLNGTVSIGGMETTFLEGFPGISLNLRDVILRDSLWHQHRHTLLQAKNLDISVNVIALLTGTIRINRIAVSNASVYLFTDSTGYSNTSVFKSSKQQREEREKEGGTPAEINRFSFEKVAFVLDNRLGNKFFRFVIYSLKGKMDHRLSGWKANFGLNALISDMAFNTNKGSFLKDKPIAGSFYLKYTEKKGVIEVERKKIAIGGDDYIIGAHFSTAKNPVDFVITIDSEKLIWKHASSLLTRNISSKLNMFDLTQPVAVKAVIAGNMGRGSQPAVDVSCKVKNNVLSSPGGMVDNCSFSGFYSNHHKKGQGNNDENSIIKLMHFTGNYEQIPINMDTVFITNLVKPEATGTLKSKFQLSRLNQVVGDEFLKFNNGSADINVRYRASIADFELSKPVFTGTIAISNANVDYQPRRLNFKNSDILLNFTDKDLILKDIRLQSGSSIMHIQGIAKNFMNLYYTAPEKMLFSCNITSPGLNLGEFLGLLAPRRKVIRVKKRKGKTDFVDQLSNVMDRSKVDMHLRLGKIIYDKFIASDAKANLTMSESGIQLRNVFVRHGGGTVRLSGRVNQKSSLNRFAVNATISNVNIRHFFYSFDNFGLESFTYKNLKGYLFSKTNISGSITDEGKIVPRSFNGSVIFDLRRGALLHFGPLQGVAKFAFPFRNLDSITFSNLNGKFDIMGNKVRVNPMKISSSVINMDVAGIYSLNKGTNIALDIPLRNPERDKKIKDKKEKEERRMKGIVLHILATDDENGKIKFKWNKNHD